MRKAIAKLTFWRSIYMVFSILERAIKSVLWVYKKRNTDLIFSFLINNLSGLHEGCLQQVRVFRENTSGSRNKCFIVILRSLLPRRKRTLLLGDNWISCHETRLVLNSIQQPQHAVWKCVAITALEHCIVVFILYTWCTCWVPIWMLFWGWRHTSSDWDTCWATSRDVSYRLGTLNSVNFSLILVNNQ